MLEVEPRKKARAVHALSHLVYAHLQLYGILLAAVFIRADIIVLQPSSRNI